ncbi:MAG TPA: CDP-alcohol phosphatidyltransferase family protein [Gammaproteobacteria bacterium]|nr:CDP-alcohol phosphatidyltransferase family protein [Gammaproteobacteria bacterium]
MKRSDIPNLITFGRILLVAPTAWALLQRHYPLALVLFFVAGLSDGIDGFLAKHYGWTSRLGALLDPVADKALLVSCYATLAWTGLLPLWLLILVVVRDVVIVAGAALYNYRIRRLEAEPTLISKLNTLLQISLVLLVIVQQIWPRLPPAALSGLVWAVSVTVVWSGIDYVVTWSRRARREQQGPS